MTEPVPPLPKQPRDPWKPDPHSYLGISEAAIGAGGEEGAHCGRLRLLLKASTADGAVRAGELKSITLDCTPCQQSSIGTHVHCSCITKRRKAGPAPLHSYPHTAARVDTHLGRKVQRCCRCGVPQIQPRAGLDERLFEAGGQETMSHRASACLCAHLPLCRELTQPNPSFVSSRPHWARASVGCVRVHASIPPLHLDDGGMAGCRREVQRGAAGVVDRVRRNPLVEQHLDDLARYRHHHFFSPAQQAARWSRPSSPRERAHMRSSPCVPTPHLWKTSLGGDLQRLVTFDVGNLRLAHACVDGRRQAQRQRAGGGP